MIRIATVLLVLLAEPLLAAVAFVQPRDEDIRILEVRLDDEILTSELISWQHHGGGILLPLGQLSQVLGLAINVKPAEGIATGFVARENRTFHLDLNRGELTIEGSTTRFDPTLLALHEDDLYVDSTLLSEWLRIDFDVDLFALRLTVRPREPLPLQLRRAREQKMKRSRAGARTDPGFPVLEDPYASAALPFIDQNLRLTWGDDQLEGSYATYATGDLFGMESAWYAQGDREESLRELRVTLGRKDPEPRLLGFLGAREFAIGHVPSPGSTLVSQSKVPTPGILISNYPLQRPTQFTSHSFYGDLQPGWDVELYHNRSLTGYQTSRGDGRYEFEEVPLLFGFNFFQLVFYGPQGQRRVENHRFVVGASLTEPGEFHYRISANRERGWVGPSASDPPDDYRVLMQMDLGIHKRLSAAVEGAVVPLPDGQQGSFGKVGLRTYLDFLFAWADFVQEQEGGSATELGLQTRVLGFHVTASRIELTRDFASEIFPGSSDQVAHRDQLRLDTSIPAWILPRIPITLEATQDELFSGRTRTRARSRISAYYRGYSAANELRWNRETGLDPHLDGGFRLSRFFRGHSLRSEVNYLLEPVRDLASINFAADGFLTRRYRYNLGVTRSLAAGTDLFTVGINKLFEKIAVGGQVVYDTRGDLSVRLDFSTGIGFDPRENRWITGARPIAGFGAASVRAFLDENLNGVHDAGEELIEGVTFTVDGVQSPAVTDREGMVLLTHLPVYRSVDLGLAVRSLEDPAWVPLLEGVRFVPRPGNAVVVDFPVVLTGEIDGTVLVKRSGRTTAAGGVTLQLTDTQGRILQQTKSAYDGFYLFSPVQPGTYVLRLAPPDVARMDLVAPPGRAITIEADGTVLSGIDLALATRGDDLQVAQQREPASPLDPEQAVEPPAEKRSRELPIVRGGGGYSVQLGAFRVEENAVGLAALMTDRGHEPSIYRKGELHLVSVGSFTTRAEANRLRRRLRAEGMEGFVTTLPPHSETRRNPVPASTESEATAVASTQLRPPADRKPPIPSSPLEPPADRAVATPSSPQVAPKPEREKLPAPSSPIETPAERKVPKASPPQPTPPEVEPAPSGSLPAGPPEVSRMERDGAIFGVVGFSDPASSRIVPAAGRTVTLAELGTRQITNAAGEFHFAIVPNGTYTLIVYVQGEPLRQQIIVAGGEEVKARIFLP